MNLNDVTRLLSRWLQHDQYGVNVLVTAIPRAIPGSVNPDPEPSAVDVYDDTQGDVINDSIELDPPSSPALIVFTTAGAVAGANARHGVVQNVRATVVYTTRDTPTDVATRDSGYVLRAAEQSVLLLNDQSKSEGYREVNGIKIVQVSTVGFMGVAGAVGRSKMWGLLQLSLRVVVGNT